MSPLFWVCVRRREPAERFLFGCSWLASKAPPSSQRFLLHSGCICMWNQPRCFRQAGCGLCGRNCVQSSPWLTPWTPRLTRHRALKKWPGIRGGAPVWSDWWRTRFSRTSSLLSRSNPQWSTGRWWKNAGSSWTRYPSYRAIHPFNTMLLSSDHYFNAGFRPPHLWCLGNIHV